MIIENRGKKRTAEWALQFLIIKYNNNNRRRRRKGIRIKQNRLAEQNERREWMIR